jgi:aminomethyltransferase
LSERGERIGIVTSGTLSPLTRESIGMAWVDAAYAEEGTSVAVSVRGLGVPGTVTAPPFYTP